jgi:ATP-dependent RNA helicase DDX27
MDFLGVFFSIQAATIPTALAGRDICGCAATGTGKTAAYMLPVLERLLFRPRGEESTRVLLLVPTRELGVQVFQVNLDYIIFLRPEN